ncbi:hypothetical protein ETAR_04410 [Edwardsiella tarda]
MAFGYRHLFIGVVPLQAVSPTHGVNDVFCSYADIGPAFRPALSFVVTPKIPACGLFYADDAAIVTGAKVSHTAIEGVARV